jgi:LacI family transcriptional regulator
VTEVLRAARSQLRLVWIADRGFARLSLFQFLTRLSMSFVAHFIFQMGTFRNLDFGGPLCYTENVYRNRFQEAGLGRITIKDVALRAAVSPATVSRVLNGQGYHIRQETRQRVLQSIEELGFTPDRRAQTLRKHKTEIIGVVMPDISNPFFSLLVRGVEHQAKIHSYSVIICDSENTLEGESYAVETLLRERVDGVIVTPIAAESACFSSFLDKSVSLVVCDRRLNDPSTCQVVVDSVQDGYRLTRHLLERGYREIAFIQGPPQASTAIDRYEGYRRALIEHRVEVKSQGREQGDYTFEGGYKAARRLLRRQQPEAIIAANDLMAIGALYALKEKGLRVPEEMGVAGFDNIPLASWVHPRLTTIEIPAYRMGQEAMRLLVRCMNEQLVASQSKLLKSKLVPGQSCRAGSLEIQEAGVAQ